MMESFDQKKVSQEMSVRSEVSDASQPIGCEQSDDEGLLLGSTQDSVKRTYEDEQDSSLDSNNGGSPLPPRKRAKTTEEKEQRRMERIMRNRQAAHASREKKRRHLEMLESKCSTLETENMTLRNQLSTHDQLRAHVEQLEAAIKLAKSSGDLKALDSIKAPSLPESLDGTVAGMFVGSSSAAPLKEQHQQQQTLPQTQQQQTEPAYNQQLQLPHPSVSGSPAPSLEEDCTSPDAMFIKPEEDIFPPFSPEKPIDSLEDPFGMMNNFSFDSNLASADIHTNSESSLKSRHPAVLMAPSPLLLESDLL